MRQIRVEIVEISFFKYTGSCQELCEGIVSRNELKAYLVIYRNLDI